MSVEPGTNGVNGPGNNYKDGACNKMQQIKHLVLFILHTSVIPLLLFLIIQGF
jgi:hypothetical protein